jgi:glycosyltransferase involved in cell wall biosynthesis
MEGLISIIIPIFNREQLIAETLSSIVIQTYENWECIVIDDGSEDRTLQILKEYSKKDSRIKYYSRPNSIIKGANSCRNYGFNKSKGDYIIWFDSDDLMTPNHIEKKVTALQSKKLDFVVARTQNFRNGKFLKPYEYIKKPYGITVSDFILLKIHWYTYDVLMKRTISEKISWNEKMRSWQDYNYFCKMLLISENGNYIDEILTHRRIHSNSIQKSLLKDSRTFNTELLENRVLTYHDISANIDFYTRRELVYGLMNICLELAKMKVYTSCITEVAKIVKEQIGTKSFILFRLALISAQLTNKGYYFLNMAKLK